MLFEREREREREAVWSRWSTLPHPRLWRSKDGAARLKERCGCFKGWEEIEKGFSLNLAGTVEVRSLANILTYNSATTP